MGDEGNGRKSETIEQPGMQRSVRADAVTVERAAVGLVHAEQAELRASGAGVVFASKDVTIERGGARDVVAGGAVRITQGGAGLILAGGDTGILKGGAATIVSLGRTEIAQGGAGVLAAGSATVGRGGIVLLALTPRLDVAAGGRVVGGPMAALAALALAFVGVILLRRR